MAEEHGYVNVPNRQRCATVVLVVEKNGELHASLTAHSQKWGEVYAALHKMRAEIDRVIASRRDCPMRPKKGKRYG